MLKIEHEYETPTESYHYYNKTISSHPKNLLIIKNQNITTHM